MKRILFLLIAAIISVVSRAQVACPSNIDFETGGTSVWDYYTGTCCPISTPTLSGALSGRHTLVASGGVDPYGFFPVVAPGGGGGYALKLGNSSTGAQAEKARYYIRVPTGATAYAIAYRYAMVLQDGGSGHDTTSQPRFEVKAYDSATGSPITCAQYKYIANSTIPGFNNSLIDASVKFKTWTTATINLSGMTGRTAILDFATGDCSLGGHFGYAYVDATCALFSIEVVGCDSDIAYVTAPSGFAAYRWYDSTDFSTVVDTNQFATVRIRSTPVTYAVVIQPFSGFGCQDTLYAHVLPSRLTVRKMNDTAVCVSAGRSITLNVNANDIPGAMPLSYYWSPSTALSCTSCANPVATPSVPTTYYFTVTNAVGCSYSDSIRIMGNTLATIVAARSTSCYGTADGAASATITSGTPPYRYYWSTSPIRTTPTITGLLAGVYTVSVSDTTGCSGVFSITVPQPPPNIFRVNVINPTTCGGSDGSIVLSGFIPGSVDTIYYRTPSGTPVTYVGTASSTGTITISGLSQTSTGSYDSIRVLTRLCPWNDTTGIRLYDPPLPPAPAVTPQRYCQFETAVPAIATGSSLKWYTSIGGTASSVAPTPNTSTAHTEVYYVTQTVANCQSLPATVTIPIFPKPATPPTLDTAYCQRAPSAYLVAVGDSLLWYTTATGGVHIDSTPKPSTAVVGATTWYVEQHTDGCVSDRAPLTVRVLYVPEFGIAADRQGLCQFDTIGLSYNGPSLVDAQYHWSLAVGEHFVNSTSADSAIRVRFDSTRFQRIILRVSNYNGKCVNYDSVNLRVVERPAATFYLKENICEGDTITLALSDRSANADHYNWDFGGASIITANSSSGGPYKVRFSGTGAHVLRLTAFTAEECRGRTMVDTVKILPRPSARIFVSTLREQLCMEDSVRFYVSDTNNRSYTYHWSPEHFFGSNGGSVIWGRIETAGFVKVTVTDAFGCKASDSVRLTPDGCCKVTFPNAFTPNNDGRNDHFRPVFNGYHRFHSFRIANRWGQVVFETTNSNGEWDGTFGGVPQDMGTYFYYLKYDCGGESLEEEGSFTLIR